MPNIQALQVFYGMLPVFGAILLANWNNNKRLDDFGRRVDDLKASLNGRIDDLKSSMDNQFREVNVRLDKLTDRVDNLEKATRLVRS